MSGSDREVKRFVVEHRKITSTPSKRYEAPSKHIKVCKEIDTSAYNTYGRSVSKVYGWGN